MSSNEGTSHGKDWRFFETKGLGFRVATMKEIVFCVQNTEVVKSYFPMRCILILRIM